jgi:L-methionine (R)-S-oxide reductase
LVGRQSQQVRQQIRRVMESADGRATKAERAAELVRRAGAYRWVGVYDVIGDEIALLAWSGPGPPAVPRFPVSQGLCGAAVRSGATVIVGDVTRDGRYLTTFGSTRSEAVIPVIRPATGAAVGVVDVESERVNAFTEGDRTLLEACAAEIASLWE